MNKADIPFLSAAELAVLIKSKEVSPLDATEAYLERIDDLDFKFNAYLTVLRDDAMRAAGEAEQAISQGDYLGPMHGIPVAVKDQVWTKGIRTTDGSHFLADFIPNEDATVITNLKRAGAIILGKANLTEFALRGFNHRFSNPRNPWNLDYSAGGSSSGSGAATAAYLCATSLGEDTSGSIRCPASWSGLVGLRPSWGRVSRYGVFRGVWSMDAIGPISRTVEDAAITLGAIAGYDAKDQYTWNTLVPDYKRVLDGDVRGLRAGLITDQINSELVEPEIRDTVLKSTTVLRELGMSVEDVSIPLIVHDRLISMFQTPETALDHREWLAGRLSEYGHDNRVGFLTGSIMPAQHYYKAQKLRALLQGQILEALGRFDVLLLPTSGKTAKLVEDDREITSKEMARGLTYVFTAAFALAGAPALSVPCGLSSDNLPIGLQIAGRPDGEKIVLKVAHAYERSTPWHTMRPPFA